jgi:3-oxoacyl-[acyl-carrier protein] reductase
VAPDLQAVPVAAVARSWPSGRSSNICAGSPGRQNEPHGSWLAGQGVPGGWRQPGSWFRRGTGARRGRSAGAAQRTPREHGGRGRGPAGAGRDRFGRLDGALISVGGSPGGTVADTADDAWRSAFESVFLGAVRLARELAADLAAGREGTDETASLPGTGGSIAFVLAASVRAPLPGLAISNGLFPGLAGVVKTLADEHGPAGIRINGLLPVRIATDRVRQLDALLGDPDEVRARLSQTIPLRRYGEVAEFGQAAAFLLSPAASYITGAMIPVDGGAIRSF